MLIENKNIEDLLEYLNPMSKSELDNLLSDTPQLFKDCISYFSDKIVAGDVKAKDVKDFLSEKVSSWQNNNECDFWEIVKFWNKKEVKR